MPRDRYVTQEEMLVLLRAAFEEDKQEDFLWQLAERTTDPVQPRGSTGRRRIHPVLLLSILLAVLTCGLIFYVAKFTI